MSLYDSEAMYAPPSGRTPQLNEGEQLCNECGGLGRVIFMHLFIPPSRYIDCGNCGGAGKTRICKPCRISGCPSPEHIDQLDELMLKTGFLEPLMGLCRDHRNTAEHHKWKLTEQKNAYE